MDGGRLRPTESSRRNSRETLKTLLCDDTFVDYFNVFLNLPVFGQRALLKRHSRGFVFSPPVKGLLYNRHVLDWFLEERYSLFIRTRLAYEFRLASKLQRVRFSFRFKTLGVEEGYGTELLHNLCRHLLGNVGGMYLFREHLRGTAGQRVLACWMHVQAFRKVKDPARRAELLQTFRRHYLKPLPWLLPPGLTDLVALDILNFPVVPLEEERALRARQGMGKRLSQLELDPQCREALAHVQRVLLLALQSYWLPCYLLHVLASGDVKLLEELAKPTRHAKVDLEKFAALVKRYAVYTRTALAAPPHPAGFTDRRTMGRAEPEAREGGGRGGKGGDAEGGERATEEEKGAETEGGDQSKGRGQQLSAAVDSLPSLTEVADVQPLESVLSPVVFDFSNVYRLSAWQPWGTESAVVRAVAGYDTDPSGRLLRKPTLPQLTSLFPDRVPSDTSQPVEAEQVTPSLFLSICGGFRFEHPTAPSPTSVGTTESLQSSTAPTSSRSVYEKVFGPFLEQEAIALTQSDSARTTPTVKAAAEGAELAESTNLGEEGQRDPSQEGEEGQSDPSQEGEEEGLHDSSQEGEEGQFDPSQYGEEDQYDPSQEGEEGQFDPSQYGEEDQHDPSQEGEEGQQDPSQEGEEDQQDPSQVGEEGQPDPSQEEDEEGQQDFGQEFQDPRGFNDNSHGPLSSVSSATSHTSLRTTDSGGSSQHTSFRTTVEGLTEAGVVLDVESLPQENPDVRQDEGLVTFLDVFASSSRPGGSDRASQHTAWGIAPAGTGEEAGHSPASTAGTESEPQGISDSSSEHDTCNNTSRRCSPKGPVTSPEEYFLLGKTTAQDPMRHPSQQARIFSRLNVSEAFEVSVPLVCTLLAQQKYLLGDCRRTAQQLRTPRLVRDKDVSTSPDEDEVDEEGSSSEESRMVDEQDFLLQRRRQFDQGGPSSDSSKCSSSLGEKGHTFRSSFSVVQGEYTQRSLASVDLEDSSSEFRHSIDEGRHISQRIRSSDAGRRIAENVDSGNATQTDHGVIEPDARQSRSTSSSASGLKQDFNRNARTSSSLSSSIDAATATAAHFSAANEGTCVYRHRFMEERSRQSSAASQQRGSAKSACERVLAGPGATGENLRTASLSGPRGKPRSKVSCAHPAHLLAKTDISAEQFAGRAASEGMVRNRITRARQNEESTPDCEIYVHDLCQRADVHLRTCRSKQEADGQPDRGSRATGVHQTNIYDQKKGARKAAVRERDSAGDEDEREQGSLGEAMAHLGLRVSPCSSSGSLYSLDSLSVDVATADVTTSGSDTSLSSDVAGSGSCSESGWCRFSHLRSSGSGGTSPAEQSPSTFRKRAGQYLATQNREQSEPHKDIPKKPGPPPYVQSKMESSDVGPLFVSRKPDTSCRSSRSVDSLQDLLFSVRDGKEFRPSASDHLHTAWIAVTPRSLLREALAASDAAIVADKEKRRGEVRQAEGKQSTEEEENEEFLLQTRRRRRRQSKAVRHRGSNAESRNVNDNSKQLGGMSRQDSHKEQGVQALTGGNSEASSFPEIDVSSCSSDDATKRAANRRRDDELLDCNFNSNPQGDLDVQVKEDLGLGRSVFSDSSSSEDFDDDGLSSLPSDTELGEEEIDEEEEGEEDAARKARRAEAAQRSRERQLAKLVWRTDERTRRKQVREEERRTRQLAKEQLTQERQAKMRQYYGPEGEQRHRLTLAALTQHALRDLLQQHKKDVQLDTLLAFFLYGSRDALADTPKSDRRMLCLMACDVMAGEAFRGYLKAKRQKFFAKYLEFWVAMRRYVQRASLTKLLWDNCGQLLGMVQLHRVAGPPNCHDIHKLIDQQVEHLGRAFLKDSFHTDPLAELGEQHEQVLKQGLKERLLDDLKARRHTPLISDTMNVIANILCSPATRYVLHDLRRFHKMILRDVSPVSSLEALVTTKSDVNCPWRQEPETEEILAHIHADGAAHAQSGPKPCLLTENHRLRAFNYIIAVSEDLNAPPFLDLTDLVAMVWSDLGSLHIHYPAVVRQPLLRRLRTPKRMTADQLKGLTTLTKTIFDMQVDEQADDIFSEDVDEDMVFPRRQSCLTRPLLDRLRTRRNAICMDPLPQPENFEQILADDLQRCFFRLYLLSQCPPDVDALKFVQAVQELSQVLDPEVKARYMDIVRQKYLLGPRNKNLLVNLEMVARVGNLADLSVHDLTVLQVRVKKALRDKWKPESTTDTFSLSSSSNFDLEDPQLLDSTSGTNRKDARTLLRLLEKVMSETSLITYRKTIATLTPEAQLVYMKKVMSQKGLDVEKLMEDEKARMKVKRVTITDEEIHKTNRVTSATKKASEVKVAKKSVEKKEGKKSRTSTISQVTIDDSTDDEHGGKKSKKEKERLKAQREKEEKARLLRMQRAMSRWIKMSRLFMKFLRTVRNPAEAAVFEEYLRHELDKVDVLSDKKVAQGDNVTYVRKLGKDQQITVNRLPNDLRFFVQVDRYRKQVLEFSDQTLKGRSGRRGSRRASLHFDQAFFNTRASVIVDCFLNDLCSPTPCQINVSDVDANKMVQTYLRNGASTGLFHIAIVRIFPILFSFYRNFIREGKFIFDSYSSGLRVGDNPHPTVPVPYYDKATDRDVVRIWVEPGEKGPLPHADPVLIQPISPRLKYAPYKHRPPPGNADLVGIGRVGPVEHRLRFSLVAGLSHVIPLDPEERKVREEERQKLRQEQEMAEAEARRKEEQRKEKERQEKERERMQKERERQEREKEKQERREQAKLTKGMSIDVFSGASVAASPSETKLLENAAPVKVSEEVAPRYAPAVAEALAIQEAMRKKHERKKVVKVQLRTDPRHAKYPFLLDESVPFCPEYLLLPNGQLDPRVPCTSALNRALLKMDVFPAPQQPVSGGGGGDEVVASSPTMLLQDPCLLTNVMSMAVRRHPTGRTKHHQMVDGTESVPPLWSVKDPQMSAEDMQRKWKKFLDDEAKRLRTAASLPEGWEKAKKSKGKGKKTRKMDDDWEKDMPKAIDPAVTMMGSCLLLNKGDKNAKDKKKRDSKSERRKGNKDGEAAEQDQKVKKARPNTPEDSPTLEKRKRKAAGRKGSRAQKLAERRKTTTSCFVDRQLAERKKTIKLSKEKTKKKKDTERTAAGVKGANLEKAAKSQGKTTKKKETKEGSQTFLEFPKLLPPIAAHDHIACMKAAELGQGSYVTSSSSDLAQARVAAPSAKHPAAAKMGTLPDNISLLAEQETKESPETLRARLSQERKHLILPRIPQATLQPLLSDSERKAKRPLQKEGTTPAELPPSTATTTLTAVPLPPCGRGAARPSVTEAMTEGSVRLWRGFGAYGSISTDQQVCALVEMVHQQTTRSPSPPPAVRRRHRLERPDSGLAAALASTQPGPGGSRPQMRASMSRDRTVDAKPPDLTLPSLALKDGSFDAESRGSDQFSQKARALAFKEGNPAVNRGRVTTPDMSETQKLRKRRQRRESQPRKDK